MMKSTIAEILITLLSLIINANAQCEYKSPGQDYQASWYLDKATNIVHFKLTATQKATGGFWTGIGFGEKMQGGDFIIVTSANNQVTVSDRTGIGYTQPIEDREQDVKDFKGRLENGVIQAEFSRSVKTADPRDLAIIDKGNCQDFIFPISGGPATETSVQKHTSTPVVQKICNIDQCPPFGGDSSAAAGGNVAAGGTPTSGGSAEQTTPPGIGAAKQTEGGAGTNGASEAGGSVTRGNRPTDEYQTTPSPTVAGGANTGSGTGGIGVGSVGVGGASTGDSADCSFKEGDYNVNWVYDQATQSVKFTISAPLTLNRWTGIGFGQLMQGGDMIIIYDANGVVSISDRHGAGHVEPQIDARQDLTAFQNTYNGNKLEATFTRRVNTGDVDDLPLVDQKTNCQYFMFPVSGGTITAGPDGKVTVGVHGEKPITKLICKITTCGASSVVPAQPTVGGDVTPAGGSQQPTVGGGGAIVNAGKGRPCPPRDDHVECRRYVNEYLTVVYLKFPKSDPITAKACDLLHTHQNFTVYRECCHYLSQPDICGRFLDSSLPTLSQITSAGGNPTVASGANISPNNQPTNTGVQPTGQNQPQPTSGGNNNNDNNQPESRLPNRPNAQDRALTQKQGSP